MTLKETLLLLSGFVFACFVAADILAYCIINNVNLFISIVGPTILGTCIAYPYIIILFISRRKNGLELLKLTGRKSLREDGDE